MGDQDETEGLTFSADALVQAAYLLGDHPAFVVPWQKREILSCNAAVTRVFGYTPDELRGADTRILHVSDEDYARFGDISCRVMDRSLDGYHCHHQMRRRDGTVFLTEHFVQPICDHAGHPVAVVSIVRDLSEQARHTTSDADAQIFSTPAPGAVLQLTSDAMEQFYCTFVAGTLADTLGLSVHAMQSDIDLLYDCIADEDQATLREAFAHATNTLIPFSRKLRTNESLNDIHWIRILDQPYLVDDGRLIHEVVLLDISRQMDEIEHRDRFDSVTGLMTRRGLVKTIEDRIRHRGWDPAARIVMLDIKSQRSINGAYGYESGDQFLSKVGHRLEEQAGSDTIVARAGGDKFAAYLPGPFCQSAETHEHPLVTFFQNPFSVHDTTIHAEARFGYATAGPQARDLHLIIREAELALFEARNDRDRDWAVYTPGLGEQIQQRSELTRELREALNNDQFELRFQPKIDMRTGRIVSAETLTRWRHPTRGVLTPDHFIPEAERNQLIGPIGVWALDCVGHTLHDWKQNGGGILNIAVNVSIVQFRLGGFVDTVSRMLETYGLEPDTLTLEITESVFEQESQFLRQQMQALHDMGVYLSLDDFGTGYSSLLYLQQYPFDEIKIDQTFVNRMLTDPYSRKIVTTVVDIADALGAKAVAEGVETPEVRDALLELGCTIGQGYYFSRPIPTDAFYQLIHQNTALPAA